MTDVNKSPLQWPSQSPSDIWHFPFLDPNSKGTRDGCINFSREPSRFALNITAFSSQDHFAIAVYH
jgi:hypothetical protein